MGELATDTQTDAMIGRWISSLDARRALDALPEKTRAAFVLRIIGKYSHKEIAAKLDTTPDYTTKLVKNARAQLAESLQAYRPQTPQTTKLPIGKAYRANWTRATIDGRPVTMITKDTPHKFTARFANGETAQYNYKKTTTIRTAPELTNDPDYTDDRKARTSNPDAGIIRELDSELYYHERNYNTEYNGWTIQEMIADWTPRELDPETNEPLARQPRAPLPPLARHHEPIEPTDKIDPRARDWYTQNRESFPPAPIVEEEPDYTLADYVRDIASEQYITELTDWTDPALYI
jgi:hypothetical protein